MTTTHRFAKEVFSDLDPPAIFSLTQQEIERQLKLPTSLQSQALFNSIQDFLITKYFVELSQAANAAQLQLARIRDLFEAQDRFAYGSDRELVVVKEITAVIEEFRPQWQSLAKEITAMSQQISAFQQQYDSLEKQSAALIEKVDVAQQKIRVKVIAALAGAIKNVVNDPGNPANKLFQDYKLSEKLQDIAKAQQQVLPPSKIAKMVAESHAQVQVSPEDLANMKLKILFSDGGAKIKTLLLISMHQVKCPIADMIKVDKALNKFDLTINSQKANLASLEKGFVGIENLKNNVLSQLTDLKLQLETKKHLLDQIEKMCEDVRPRAGMGFTPK